MTGQPEDSPGFSTMGLNAGKVVARRVNLRADHPNLVPAIVPHEVTHVVLADLWLPANVDTARDLVRTLAAAYGATVDDADLAEHVRLGHVATAELTRGHLRLTSAYPAPR